MTDKAIDYLKDHKTYIQYLADNGYNVKVFDLVHLSNSDQFNPFHYMKSELDIDRVTEAIIDGTKNQIIKVKTFGYKPICF